MEKKTLPSIYNTYNILVRDDYFQVFVFLFTATVRHSANGIGFLNTLEIYDTRNEANSYGHCSNCLNWISNFYALKFFKQLRINIENDLPSPTGASNATAAAAATNVHMFSLYSTHKSSILKLP